MHMQCAQAWHRASIACHLFTVIVLWAWQPAWQPRVSVPTCVLTVSASNAAYTYMRPPARLLPGDPSSFKDDIYTGYTKAEEVAAANAKHKSKMDAATAKIFNSMRSSDFVYFESGKFNRDFLETLDCGVAWTNIRKKLLEHPEVDFGDIISDYQDIVDKEEEDLHNVEEGEQLRDKMQARCLPKFIITHAAALQPVAAIIAIPGMRSTQVCQGWMGQDTFPRCSVPGVPITTIRLLFFGGNQC